MQLNCFLNSSSSSSAAAAAGAGAGAGAGGAGGAGADDDEEEEDDDDGLNPLLPTLFFKFSLSSTLSFKMVEGSLVETTAFVE